MVIDTTHKMPYKDCRFCVEHGAVAIYCKTLKQVYEEQKKLGGGLISYFNLKSKNWCYVT